MAFGIRLSKWGIAWVLVCSAANVHAQQPTNSDPRLVLAQGSNCMSCHSISRDFMGPSFKHVAARYADVPGAHEIVARKIAEGGVGDWGVVPMPANTQVTPDQAHALADWILSLK
ncbi:MULTISPECIES: c-type cytochrome [Burkholderiaceae]|uniref:Cytochrome c551/c552 n=1 Tax=Caballeronia sordidicola TaxID=196367 RepID=A0A242MGQ6_CABSO|nr:MULTISPECIES: c-type cytochrome [Burkholderiaceae]MDP9153641.1 c-type cytochrome [Pseudomonadota bacterium]OTP70138.1 Cytochrome c551/c552 [Caballeronia sordidicola]